MKKVIVKAQSTSRVKYAGVEYTEKETNLKKNVKSPGQSLKRNTNVK